MMATMFTLACFSLKAICLCIKLEGRPSVDSQYSGLDSHDAISF